MTIHGTGGWLSIADPFNCPADVATTITIGSGGDDHPHASMTRTFTVPAADQYGLQATALVDAIIHGDPAPVPMPSAIGRVEKLTGWWPANDPLPLRQPIRPGMT